MCIASYTYTFKCISRRIQDYGRKKCFQIFMRKVEQSNIRSILLRWSRLEHPSYLLVSCLIKIYCQCISCIKKNNKKKQQKNISLLHDYYTIFSVSVATSTSETIQISNKSNKTFADNISMNNSKTIFGVVG